MAKPPLRLPGSGGESRFGAAVDDFLAATDRFSEASQALSAGAESLRQAGEAQRALGPPGPGWAAGGGPGFGPGASTADGDGIAATDNKKLKRAWSGLDTAPHAVASMAFLADKAVEAAGKLGKMATAAQQASEAAGTFASRRRAVFDSMPLGVGKAANDLVGGMYSTAYYFTEEGQARRGAANQEYEHYGREMQRHRYVSRIDQAGKRRDLDDELFSAQTAATTGRQWVAPAVHGAARFALSPDQQDATDPATAAAREATMLAARDRSMAQKELDRAGGQAAAAASSAAPFFGRPTPAQLEAAGKDPGRATAGQAPLGPGGQLGSPEEMSARLDAYRKAADNKGDGSDPHAAQRRLNDEINRQLDYQTRAGAQLNQQQEALNKLKAQGESLARKDYELAQKQTNELRTQAGLMSQRADRAESGEISYGMMDPAQQEYIKSLALRFKEQGFNALTPEEKQQLGGFGITSDAIKKGAKDQAEGDAGLQALYKEFGQETAKQLREKSVKLELEVRTKVDLDMANLEKAMTKVFEDVNKVFKDAIANRARLDEATRLKEQTQRNAGQ